MTTLADLRRAPRRPHVEWRGQLELLVVQPSPFCNLDCDYCYLPSRDDSRRMEFGTLQALLFKIFQAGLPSPRLSVVWHAGEPTAVPRDWYERAFALIQRYRSRDVALTHHFQSNGVLIDDRWCDFFVHNDVRVGISIDGPAWLHDAHRRTRDGKGTHARVLAGVRALQRAGIGFHVICVLSRDSLSYPDAIYWHLAELAPTSIGFNIEEVEADHSHSSLEDDDQGSIESKFRSFVARVVDLAKRTPRGPRIREVDAVRVALEHPAFGKITSNSQNRPGRILSVAWDGTFATFSPELLGARHRRLGDLSLGNVLFDPLPPDEDNSAYATQAQEIERGVELCREQCKYFDFCLGGVPANKLAELDAFDGTETMFCRLTQKVMIDEVLKHLKHDLDNAAVAIPQRGATQMAYLDRSE